MSLINRMLRDLSTRAPENGNVLSGIEIRGPQGASVGGSVRRVVTLVVLVVAFTAALWKFMPRPKLPVPTPRVAATAANTVVASAAPTPTPTPTPAAAPAPGASHLKMDPTLSPPAAAEKPEPVPAKSPSTSRHRSQPATLKLDSGKTAPVAKAAPRVVPSKVSAAETPERAKEPAAASAGSRDAKAAQLRYAEAAPALKRGEPATAEKALREALELDPSLHAAREALVALLLDQNRLDEAQAVLSAGLPYDPQRISYRRLGARLDLARGEAQLARARLEPSPPAVATDPEYHGLLAAAYERLSRFQDAAHVYESLIQVQPTEGHWWAGLGIARDGLGDRPGALAAYAQARTLGNLDARLLEHINKRTAALQSAD